MLRRFIGTVAIILIATIHFSSPKGWASSPLQGEVSGLIYKANTLIDEGIQSRNYGNYCNAAELLDKTNKKIRYFQDKEKGALACLAIGYSYARMRNEYTSSGFVAYLWDQERVERDAKGEWDSISEAVMNFEKAADLLKNLPQDKQSYVCFLIGLGFDALRQQARIDEKGYNRDTLYKEALVYFKRACEATENPALKAQAQGGIPAATEEETDILDTYKKLDPWSEEGVVNSSQLAKLADMLADLSLQGHTSYFHILKVNP